jgi:ABC-type multidrug transport system ATPase subunit
MNAIKTIDLCKQYGNKNVVNHLNITVPQGAIYGFIGRNGAGKSTTQKMVCGLTNPTGGAINLFEEPGIYPEMTALNNVIMQGYNIGTDDIKKRAVEALEVVGLGKAMKKKAKNLSLGMRQRLGLAVAMLGEPELLVLDESINGLDPEGIVHLRRVIEQLQI